MDLIFFILTLSYLVSCHWVPVFYCCMGSKQQTLYDELYSWIDMILLNWPGGRIIINCPMMMDFEIAMRTPWEERWRENLVLGCLFHYTQVS